MCLNGYFEARVYIELNVNQKKLIEIRKSDSAATKQEGSILNQENR